MFIRKKQNKSGSISVQIIDTSGKTNRLVKTIGSTKNQNQLKELLKEAHNFVTEYRNQEELEFSYREDEKISRDSKDRIEKYIYGWSRLNFRKALR